MINVRETSKLGQKILDKFICRFHLPEVDRIAQRYVPRKKNFKTMVMKPSILEKIQSNDNS